MNLRLGCVMISQITALGCACWYCRAESPTGGSALLATGWTEHNSGETGTSMLEFAFPAHAKDGCGYNFTPVASDALGNIYLCWLDPSARVMVARKDPSGQVTTAAIEENGMIDEGHNNASMTIDKYGYLHMAWGMHNSTWKYKVSRAPREIMAWDDIGSFKDGRASNPRGIPGVAISYPAFFKDRDNDLFVVFRNRVSTKGWNAGDQSGGLARYAADMDARNGRWTMLGGTNHPHAGNPEIQPWGGRALLWTGRPGRPDSPAYQSYVIGHVVGHDGRIHITWAFNDNNPKGWNVNRFGYAVSADKGDTWAGANGRRFDSLPMTDTNYDEVVNDHKNVWYQIPFVFVNTDGQPGISAKNNTLHCIQWWHWSGAAWNRSNVGQGASAGMVFSDGYGKVHTLGWGALATTSNSGAHWNVVRIPDLQTGEIVPDYDYLYSTANIRYMAFINESVKKVYTIKFPGHVWKIAAPIRPKSLLCDGRTGGRNVDSVAALAWDMDYCYENGTLYLYSAAGNPSTRWTHPGVTAAF